MTIKEAIRHYEESERINTELAKNCVSALAKNHNLENAEKCKQMIEWLRGERTEYYRQTLSDANSFPVVGEVEIDFNRYVKDAILDALKRAERKTE